MTPDDPRHGTNAGFQTHERDGEDPCDACRRGRLRARKSIQLDKLSGKRLTYTSDEILALMSPWLDMGITVGAIVSAAGFETQRSGHLQTRIAAGAPVRRGTYNALANVTEASFRDNHKVNADLTRTRVYSLMAAGHRLLDIPINPKGQWRNRERITIGVARTVRAHFQKNEATIGGSAHTMARARNAGHKPPFAWDDPGTLGWPGNRRRIPAPTPVVNIDQAVVLRILSGDFPPSLPGHTTNAERFEVVRRWPGGHNELARLTGWKVERYIDRGEELTA